MSDNRGQIFIEKSQTLETPYKLGDDPRPLQTAFANLFDEAAQAVYRAGSDLDEVLVERTLIVHKKDKKHAIPADFLADAQLLRQSVLKHFIPGGASNEASGLEIIAIKIIARRDELKPT